MDTVVDPQRFEKAQPGRFMPGTLGLRRPSFASDDRKAAFQPIKTWKAGQRVEENGQSSP